MLTKFGGFTAATGEDASKGSITSPVDTISTGFLLAATFSLTTLPSPKPRDFGAGTYSLSGVVDLSRLCWLRIASDEDLALREKIELVGAGLRVTFSRFRVRKVFMLLLLLLLLLLWLATGFRLFIEEAGDEFGYARVPILKGGGGLKSSSSSSSYMPVLDRKHQGQFRINNIII